MLDPIEFNKLSIILFHQSILKTDSLERLSYLTTQINACIQAIEDNQKPF